MHYQRPSLLLYFLPEFDPFVLFVQLQQNLFCTADKSCFSWPSLQYIQDGTGDPCRSAVRSLRRPCWTRRVRRSRTRFYFQVWDCRFVSSRAVCPAWPSLCPIVQPCWKCLDCISIVVYGYLNHFDIVRYINFRAVNVWFTLFQIKYF